MVWKRHYDEKEFASYLLLWLLACDYPHAQGLAGIRQSDLEGSLNSVRHTSMRLPLVPEKTNQMLPWGNSLQLHEFFAMDQR